MTFWNYWMESATTNTTTTSLDVYADNDVDHGDIINGYASTNVDYDGDIVTGHTVSTDPTLIDYPPMKLYKMNHSGKFCYFVLKYNTLEVVPDESFGVILFQNIILCNLFQMNYLGQIFALCFDISEKGHCNDME